LATLPLVEFYYQFITASGLVLEEIVRVAPEYEVTEIVMENEGISIGNRYYIGLF